jgi:hypothetical protein
MAVVIELAVVVDIELVAERVERGAELDVWQLCEIEKLNEIDFKWMVNFLFQNKN